METAGFIFSFVMLRSGIFNKSAAYVGLLGFGILLVFEVFSAFISGLSDIAMVVAGLGGILSMIWYVLIARRLFQLAGE